MKIANYIGGFRPFHNGHISMISQALNDFDKVRIIVGSYQNAISIRCPFTGKQRVVDTGGRVERFNKRFSIPGSK